MIPSTVLRLVFALDALGEAAILGKPGDTFALARTWDGMAQIATEGHWAIAFAVEGLLVLASLRLRPVPRMAITTVLAFGHFLNALTFARSSHYLSVSALDHAVFTLLAWWLLSDDVKRFRRAK